MKPLIIKPGMDIQKTHTLSGDDNVGRTGWVDGNLVRFDPNSGLLQKYGGWSRLMQDNLSGMCRGIFSWDDYSATHYLVMGTEQLLYAYSGGALGNITPVAATRDLSSPFTTVKDSTAVLVADAANTVAAGDWIDIVNPIYVNGLLLQGLYCVTVAGNPFEITAASAAASSGAGGTAAQFTSANGSADITVDLTAHGLEEGDTYTVLISTTVANVTILGSYAVKTVNSADQFVFTQGTAANADATVSENTGKARIEYLLSTGLASLIMAQGYGTGSYGLGPYGAGIEAGSEVRPRQWFFGKWGESVVCNFSGDGIYYWDVSAGLVHNPATVISQAPSPISSGIFVASEQQQIIALAAGPSAGVSDPMLVRWCDVSDYTVWTATASNQAGSYRLSHGSRIMGGLSAPQQNLIWTDTSLTAMQYIGMPYVWSFTTIGKSCGLIAPRACGVLGDMVLWMSFYAFFKHEGGGLAEIPCPVWDYIFKNLNRMQYDKIFAAPNSFADEMTWFFPSADSDEVDSYVKVLKNLTVWDFGKLSRTAWIDQSSFGTPLGVDDSGCVFEHETGNDADGEVMQSWAKTSWFKIAEGNLILFLERMLPDFKAVEGTPTLNLTVYTMDNPSDEENNKVRTYGPFTITSKTDIQIIRARGRFASLKVESNDLGTLWRMGAPFYHVQQTGKV